MSAPMQRSFSETNGPKVTWYSPVKEDKAINNYDAEKLITYLGHLVAIILILAFSVGVLAAVILVKP